MLKFHCRGGSRIFIWERGHRRLGAHTHLEGKSPSPLHTGSKACLKALEALGFLMLSRALWVFNFKHSDTEWDFFFLRLLCPLWIRHCIGAVQKEVKTHRQCIFFIPFSTKPTTFLQLDIWMLVGLILSKSQLIPLVKNQFESSVKLTQLLAWNQYLVKVPNTKKAESKNHRVSIVRRLRNYWVARLRK